jgi:hypothetical protein
MDVRAKYLSMHPLAQSQHPTGHHPAEPPNNPLRLLADGNTNTIFQFDPERHSSPTLAHHPN